MACDVQERCCHRATLPDIVEFIEHQVKIAADPVFGNIQDTTKSVQSKNGSKDRYQHQTRSKESSFSTTATSVHEKARMKKGAGSLEKKLACTVRVNMHWSCALYWKRRHIMTKLPS